MGDRWIVNSNGKCAPGINYKDNVCLNTNELQKILELYSKNRNTEIPIPKHRKKLVQVLYNEESECNDKMKDVCILDKLLNSDNVDKHELLNIKKNNYRAKKPESWKTNPTEWLSNFDIDNVMFQYNKAYKTFSYLGTYPIDFMEKSGPFCITKHCDFHLNKYKGKKEFSMVLNLDKHDQPGSHWVAIYINIDKKNCKYGCFFYDSFAFKPCHRILNFFKLVKSQLGDENFKGYYNKKRHQYQNSECGMFSMCFLISCLENKNKKYEDIIASIEPNKDHFINKHRDILYLSI